MYARTYSTENSSQCFMAIWMGVEFGGEWMPVLYMAESLHYSPENITTLLISYIPI